MKTAAGNADDEYATVRREMLEDIGRLARETRAETGREVFDSRVMSALDRVPRHRVVPPEQVVRAYENAPLPIGEGQTVSQPFIVALMTDLLQLEPGDRVLEIGTGSTYQTMVLAELGAKVYTVEIVETLARGARERLAELGYHQVEARQGDGHLGWREHAPFDAIIVTAATAHVPPALEDQLKAGGRLVIPVGSQHDAQTLYIMVKQSDGTLVRTPVLGVRFVPLTGLGVA